MSKKFFDGDSFQDIYVAMLSELLHRPEYKGEGRGGEKFFEITNLTFELFDPLDRLVWIDARRANYEFATRFFLWMLAGSDDFNYVRGVNPNAANYLDPKKLEGAADAKFSTAYGPRIMAQIDAVYEELVRNHGSRRAVISILDDGDLAMLPTDTKEEFPCIESMTFLIRDNRLDCQVNMRSNNMATTVVYDVFCFTMFQEYMWRRLRRTAYPILDLGTYKHHCTSAHILGREMELVGKILVDDTAPMMYRADKLEEMRNGNAKG